MTPQHDRRLRSVPVETERRNADASQGDEPIVSTDGIRLPVVSWAIAKKLGTGLIVSGVIVWRVAMFWSGHTREDVRRDIDLKTHAREIQVMQQILWSEYPTYTSTLVASQQPQP